MLTAEAIEKLKELLVLDFYSLVEIKELFTANFPDNDPTLINPYSVKLLGFKVYSGYTIKDTFRSANDYLNYLLVENDILDISFSPAGVKQIVCYSGALYRSKLEYEIIEFSPNKYINLRKLEQSGIGKEVLTGFVDNVLDFTKGDQYFTYHSLKKDSFTHPIDDLGFEDWFYTSLLVECKDHLSYSKIGNNKVFFNGNKKLA